MADFYNSDIFLDNEIVTSSNCLIHNQKIEYAPINSIRSGYIKYDLYNPSYEVSKIVDEYLHLGVQNNGYRYTGLFFFGNISSLIKSANKAELIFDIMYDPKEVESLLNDGDNSMIFNNSYSIVGHSLTDERLLVSKWDTFFKDDFRYGTRNTCVFSIRKELKDALQKGTPVEEGSNLLKTTLTIELDECLLRILEKNLINSFQIFCQKENEGLISIGKTSSFKIVEYKYDFNRTIASVDHLTKKRRKKVENNNYNFIESGSSQCFYFFDERMYQRFITETKEAYLCLNFSWSNTSSHGCLDDIHTNTSFLGCYENHKSHNNEAIEDYRLMISPHPFASKNDVKTIKSTYSAELISPKDLKDILEQGKSHVKILLTEDILNSFALEDSKGFYLYLKGTDARANIVISATCTLVPITISDTAVSHMLESEEEWIECTDVTYVGQNIKLFNTEFKSYFFFDDLYEKIKNKNIGYLTLEFYTKENDIDLNVNPVGKNFIIYGHYFNNIEEAKSGEHSNPIDELMPFVFTSFTDIDNNSYCKIKLDGYIVKEMVKRGIKGFCIGSVAKTHITSHGAKLKVEIQYSDEYGYVRRQRTMICNNFVTAIEGTDEHYNNYFLCGCVNNNRLRPFVLFGDILNDILSNKKVLAIDIILEQDDVYYIGESNLTDISLTESCVTFFNDVHVFTHNVVLGENINDQLYDKFLTKIKVDASVITITLDEKQIKTLLNSCGLGMYVDCTLINNEYMPIERFVLNITYKE